MDNKFWLGKRVLVTGHTGFKGGWLSLWLQQLGAEVVGLSLPHQEEPSLYGLCSLSELIGDSRGDIRDAEFVGKIIDSHKPEFVFHLAAQALVQESYQDPTYTYATNLMGTVNILEAVRKSEHVRALLVITSDKVYENREWDWGYREIDRLGGHDPYSSSKACAELAVSTYRKSFLSDRVGVATARAGNVIGGGDWAKFRVIPDAIKAFVAATPLEIRNPQSIRPWQHVLEALYGYLILAENLHSHKENSAGAWNFGPDYSCFRTVEWLANELISHWPNSHWQHIGQQMEHESSVLTLDSSKSRSILGWAPCLDLPEAVKWTMDWYKLWQAGENMLQVSQEQISAYQNRQHKGCA